ncbi:MAG TPA: beta-glucosidase [Anaerolineaceae bacterium]|nr:beta-glucosidase [Anaerolineaceae bacterium]
MIYQDSTRSITERVDDLLSRMTVHEKAAQLCCVWPLVLVGKKFPDPEKLKKYMEHGIGRITQFANMGYHPTAVQVAEFSNTVQKFSKENTRLGIPVLFQNEAMSGFTAVDAACFPTPQNLGAAWLPELVEEAGDIIRQEMLAVGVRQALAPVLDITTDPRWGRIHETFGEDPYLASSMGVAFVKGLQSSDLRTGVNATGKHFLGYGVSQGGLNRAAVLLNSIDLLDTYGRPFEAAIHLADMQSVMITYSDINGVPAGVSKEVIREWLYKRMEFTGHATSEGNAFTTFVERYRVAKDFKEAAIMALEAGLDGDTPISKGYIHLPELIEQGLVKEDLLDEAVKRILTSKFKLGLFDNPFVDTGKVNEVYRSKASIDLSKKLAEASIVLLKNESGLLPLQEDKQTIALIGPHSNNIRLQFPNYSYPAAVEMLRALVDGMLQDNKTYPYFTQEIADLHFKDLLNLESTDDLIAEKFPESKSLLTAMQEHVHSKIEVLQADGCDVSGTSKDGFTEALEAAKKSDIIVMALGDSSGWVNATCGEGKDSTVLTLPGVQRELLTEISQLGKPIVLVLFNGRPYADPWMYEICQSVLLVGFPGPSSADVIVSALFGDINPGGKIVMTIPRSVGQVPIYYYHKNGSGYLMNSAYKLNDNIFFGGYVNEPRTPLYDFGFGLSYTSFNLSDLEMSCTKVPIDGEIQISCKVQNTGSRVGDEVVQLYINDLEARTTRPVKELVGFKRLTLQPGETKRVTFIMKMNQLGFTDENKEFVIEPGNMLVMVGRSSADIVLRGEFEITGEKREITHSRSYLSSVAVK